MQIRKANSNDVKAIVKIWGKFLSEHDDIVTKRNSLLEEMNLRKDNAASVYEKFLVSNLKSGNGVVFIAGEGGQIAGYSLGIIKNEIPIFQVERYGYISDLYVKKEFRGRGVLPEAQGGN